jgi:hypothetical protein
MFEDAYDSNVAHFGARDGPMYLVNCTSTLLVHISR